MPFDKYIGLASGLLGWKPQDFWEATPWEFSAALKGVQEVEKAKAGKQHAVQPMTRNEYLDLKEKVKKQGL